MTVRSSIRSVGSGSTTPPGRPVGIRSSKAARQGQASKTVPTTSPPGTGNQAKTRKGSGASTASSRDCGRRRSFSRSLREPQNRSRATSEKVRTRGKRDGPLARLTAEGSQGCPVQSIRRRPDTILLVVPLRLCPVHLLRWAGHGNFKNFPEILDPAPLSQILTASTTTTPEIPGLTRRSASSNVSVRRTVSNGLPAKLANAASVHRHFQLPTGRSSPSWTLRFS